MKFMVRVWLRSKVQFSGLGVGLGLFGVRIMG